MMLLRKSSFQILATSPDIPSPMMEKACSIITRRENTSVRNNNLFILHAMLTRKKISFCNLFVPQLVKQAKGQIGNINIGGMLKPIAMKIKGNLDGYPPMGNSYLFDIMKLRYLRFVNLMTPPYYFHTSEKKLYPLPNTISILVTNFHE